MRQLKLTSEALQQIVALRRDLHRHPELGYQENRTAEVVASRLAEAGLDVTTGIAGTGVIGVLEGAKPGPSLAWRADMDALPIEEETNAEYRSCNAGVMHACGHDVHTSVGVGTAELLAQHRDQLAGRRIFLFQPNEEGAPGAGPSGAEAVVDAGVIEDFGIEHMFAFHCMPSLEVGAVGYTGEAVWAGSDRILIHVLGEQTHGAYPHLGADPIVAASQLVGALQTVASREVDTQEACVVSICQFHAGNQFNVLPEKVFLEGILRTHKDAVRERAAAAIRRICDGVGAATGTRIELELHRGALPTTNDPALLDRAVSVLRTELGEDRVRKIPAQMGAEDFASFSRAVPSVYMMLGIRNEDEGLGVHPLHSPRFDVDERCLQVGVEAAAALLAGLG